MGAPERVNLILYVSKVPETESGRGVLSVAAPPETERWKTLYLRGVLYGGWSDPLTSSENLTVISFSAELTDTPSIIGGL